MSDPKLATSFKAEAFPDTYSAGFDDPLTLYLLFSRPTEELKEAVSSETRLTFTLSHGGEYYTPCVFFATVSELDGGLVVRVTLLRAVDAHVSAVCFPELTLSVSVPGGNDVLEITFAMRADMLIGDLLKLKRFCVLIMGDTNAGKSTFANLIKGVFEGLVKVCLVVAVYGCDSVQKDSLFRPHTPGTSVALTRTSTSALWMHGSTLRAYRLAIAAPVTTSPNRQTY